jgi:general secretion pathway protein K
MVLVLSLLLSVTIVTLAQRTMIDTMIVRHRDSAARAEALARGGVRIATGLLMRDAVTSLEGDEDEPPGATEQSLWHRLGEYQLATPEGDVLALSIRDMGSRLNLNAFVPHTDSDEESEADPEAVEFLVDFFDKVIDEIPLPPGEKFYDSRELAHALIDYVDSNEDSALGGFEEDWYQEQNPPYWPANGPLLSVEELSLIRGFDSNLVKALRPYVTVHPFVDPSGINLNTAPPHVLAAVYYGSSGDMRLANEDLVRRILQLREDGNILCDDHGADPKRCTSLSEVGLGEGGIYPPASLPADSRIFSVVAGVTVGEIRRRVEAIVDRGGDESGPQLLSWQRVH